MTIRGNCLVTILIIAKPTTLAKEVQEPLVICTFFTCGDGKGMVSCRFPCTTEVTRYRSTRFFYFSSTSSGIATPTYGVSLRSARATALPPTRMTVLFYGGTDGSTAVTVTPLVRESITLVLDGICQPGVCR